MEIHAFFGLPEDFIGQFIGNLQLKRDTSAQNNLAEKQANRFRHREMKRTKNSRRLPLRGLVYPHLNCC